jgi:hypothetical protein
MDWVVKGKGGCTALMADRLTTFRAPATTGVVALIAVLNIVRKE